jgi:hypothetical protein
MALSLRSLYALRAFLLKISTAVSVECLHPGSYQTICKDNTI